jgi:hypothetical protein
VWWEVGVHGKNYESFSSFFVIMSWVPWSLWWEVSVHGRDFCHYQLGDVVSLVEGQCPLEKFIIFVTVSWVLWSLWWKVNVCGGG